MLDSHGSRIQPWTRVDSSSPCGLRRCRPRGGCKRRRAYTRRGANRPLPRRRGPGGAACRSQQVLEQEPDQGLLTIEERLRFQPGDWVGGALRAQLRDDQWRRIESMLPDEVGDRGRLGTAAAVGPTGGCLSRRCVGSPVRTALDAISRPSSAAGTARISALLAGRAQACGTECLPHSVATGAFARSSSTRPSFAPTRMINRPWTAGAAAAVGQGAWC